MVHRRPVYIYLFNVPCFSSRHFNKIKRTSRLGRLLALSLEILSNHIYPYLFCFVWFDSLRPINNLSFKQGRVFLGWISTKLGLMCLAQGHNAVTPVRLEPVATRSRVKHWATALPYPWIWEIYLATVDVKISNVSLLFSREMLVTRAGIHKILERIANR